MLNALFLFLISLIWVGGLIGVRGVFKKGNFNTNLPRWVSIGKRWGLINLFVWMTRVAIVPATEWSPWDGVTALLLIIGAFLILRRTTTTSDMTDAVHILPNDYGVFRLLLSTMDREYRWAGKTLAELNLRKRDLLVLAIRRGDEVIPFPKGPEIIASGDELLIFGRTREFKAMGDIKLSEMNGT